MNLDPEGYWKNAQSTTRKCSKSELSELLSAIRQYADRNNWGYYDESGCPKGVGDYTDACFIGPEVAEEVLKKFGR